jgi:transforming growth factor-beta-induced protein
MKSIKLLALLFLTTFIFTACNSSSSTAAETDPTIVEIAVGNDNFSTLVSALSQAGLVETLEGNGPFTVFAPTNDAFADLPQGTLESLTNDQLQSILLYHVIGAEVFAGDLAASQTVTAANGEEVFITSSAGTVRINGNSVVTAADLSASNGVIHVIDSVILPDAFGNVVDNAAKRYFLSTLVEVVTQQNLAGALQAEGPFTVFAPTNDAFNAIAEVLPTLTPEQVTNVLLYHVVPTRALSGDLQPTQEVPTLLDGQTLTVTVNNGVVSVNGSATVTSADANGTNGVIHVIDAVLIPEL